MSDDVTLGLIEQYTQSEYADRFVKEYGNRFRYISNEDCWLYYSDGRWREDQYDAAFHFSEKLSREILEETGDSGITPEGKTVKNPWKVVARERCGAGSIASVCRIARTKRPIVTNRHKFDRDPYLLNLANGTYDLRSHELYPHSPNDMITKIANASYDPKATGPTFDEYFEEVQPSAHWRDQIMRNLGYSIRGSYGEYAFIHIGHGGNGKSTLLKLIQRTLGDYANSVSWKVLNQANEGQHETILAELEGVRLPVIQMGGHSLSSEQLRLLVAEPDFKARRMQQDSHTIQATHTLHVAQNDPLPLKQLDTSTRRRIVVIGWNVDLDIDAQNDELPQMLSAELDYVMLQLLNGHADFDPAEIDRSATEGYFERNSAYRFVRREVIEDPKASVTTEDLVVAYKKWCIDEREKPVTDTAFGRTVTDMGYGKTRTIVDGHKRVVRIGIRLPDTVL